MISVPGLNRFLPDDDETAEEPFDASDEASKTESFNPRPLPEKISGRKLDSRKLTMQPDSSQRDDLDDVTDEDDGSGVDGKEQSSDDRTDGDGGDGSDQDGGREDAGDAAGAEARGGRGGIHATPTIPIRYRTFSTNAAAGVYVVTVQAEKAKAAQDVILMVWTVGDDQRLPAEISSARLPDGKGVAVDAKGMLGPVSLPKGQPLRLEVRLREPMRLAMEVSAHEAQR